MNPLVFLVDIIFQLYATALILRAMLQWAGADFYNPISQFIVKITNPPVKPMRRIIPGFGGIDVATLLLAVILIAVQVTILALLANKTIIPLAIALLACIHTVLLIISIFLYSIIIQAILSWVNPDPHNPAVSLLNSLTYPILKHFRKLIPDMGGMDISPIFAIITLMFIQHTIRFLFL